jgi:2-polyprenyl-3-methyl-5-hydroxy-6-metoxy-1,4-benzoquinol methylase
MTQLRQRSAVAVSHWNRGRKARVVSEFIRRKGVSSALLVGCGEGWTPRDQIVEAAVVELAPFCVAVDALHDHSPGPWRYVRADALRLPFADDSFDLVLSNAVIEHVGDEQAQRRFAEEHARVGKSWIITTPNRWFPVESHTNAILRHWLPAWRAKQSIFTRLLSIDEFRRLLPKDASMRGSPFSLTFMAASEPM